MPTMRPLSFLSRREPHSAVVPGRFRVPLVRKFQPEHPRRFGRYEFEVRGSPGVLGDRTTEEIDDVHLALLQSGGTRGFFRHGAEDEPLDVWRLAPVAVKGLHHQLHAWGEAHHLVRPRADGCLLEAVVTDLLDVLPRDDPSGTGRRRAVEGHEIGPGFLEMETPAPGVDDLDLSHLVLG